jgi:hypothetical protein
MMTIAKDYYYDKRLQKTLPSLQLLVVENEMLDTIDEINENFRCRDDP